MTQAVPLELHPPLNASLLLRSSSHLPTLPPPPPSLIQIPGNKMTAANLAVIFGPNLLQGEQGGDVSPHTMGIEDSTAIISVTLVLIQNYRRLFTVGEDTDSASSPSLSIVLFVVKYASDKVLPRMHLFRLSSTSQNLTLNVNQILV